MNKKISEVAKRAVMSMIAIFFVLLNPLTAAPQNEGQKYSRPNFENPWKEFHSVAGRCKMKFPNHPEHVTEKLSLSEEGYDLKYDAYISTSDKRTVYMLLIAQYPDFVDESYAQMSLEQFLNGILSHNPGNQLIFADLLLVNGHEALDFFIRTGSVYFKGRAMMVKNSLYLMAMECEMQTYDEGGFNTFINSFVLNP